MEENNNSAAGREGNETQENGYPFKLIHEEVAQQDTFKHGTHDKVANAMHRLISNESQSATIGLEGGWGSGKSTVVHLLSKKLENDPERTLVYAFDAWAHEGDPLRRIFLEGLIDSVIESSPGLSEDTKKWLEERSEVIQARKKTTRIRTNHHTTKYATWLSVSALLVPAGAAFLTQVKYDQISLTTGSFYWLFWFGIVFTLAPLIATAIWWFGCKKKWKWLGENADMSLVTSGADKDVTQDITEDGERTSIEFEKHFKEISEKIFSTGLFKRFVIVIDNLDRIERDDALKVWSTLQTFFQHRSSAVGSTDWRQKVWFIVPYDRDGLSEIWTVDDIHIQNSKSPSDSTSETNDSKHQKHVAHSFLNKCFQVRFEVPVPVMSSWQQFFMENTNTALANWPEDDRIAVVNTYQSCNSTLEESPTPREIRNFINQVGIIGTTWGGKISAESIALYCHLRYKYGELGLRKKLIEDDGIPDSIFVRGDAENVVAELSGLLFGVDKETGMELLLNTPIQTALKDGNKEELINIFQKFGSAFKIAWRAGAVNFRPVVGSEDQKYLIRFTEAFIPLATETGFEQDVSYLEGCWTKATNEKWNLGQYDYANIFSKTVMLFSPDFVNWMKKQTELLISATVSQFVKKEDSVPQAVVIQINKLEQLLKKLNNPLERGIHNELGADKWPKWITFTEKADKLPNCILPSKNAITTLAAQIQGNGNHIPETVVYPLIQIYNMNSSFTEWVSVSTNLGAWLQFPQRNSDDNIYELALELATSDSISLSKPVIDALKHQHFWASPQAQTLNGSRSYTIPTLALIAHGSNLHKAKYVQLAAKDFWKQTKPSEDHRSAFSVLLNRGYVQLIWEAARDKENVALSAPENNFTIVTEKDFPFEVILTV